MNLKMKYGETALVAGASEGMGAAFSKALAAQGIDLVLLARRKFPLQQLAADLRAKYSIEVLCIECDLAEPEALAIVQQSLQGKTINILVYNAALSYIGAFDESKMEQNLQMTETNMLTPLKMVHAFGSTMLKQGRGAIILMASLAGFQGSGYLTLYAATKAFNRIFAESLWYEWKSRGVDVIACCAGATATPNFINTKPEKAGAFAPKVQAPEVVVKECLKKLGRQPSFISGSGNKLASFFMQKVLPRKMAINIMGDTTRKMYRL